MSSNLNKIGFSLLVKTLFRPEPLSRFLNSVFEYEKKYNLIFNEVIIGDDSNLLFKEQNAEVIHNIIEKGLNSPVVHFKLPYDIGKSRAQNEMVNILKTEWFLMCDDDFLLDSDCDLLAAYNIAKTSNIDVLGGWWKNNFDIYSGTYDFWGAVGKFHETDSTLYVNLNENEYDFPDFIESDFLLTFFLGKKNVFEKTKWSDCLKTEEHYDLFYRLYKNGFKCAMTRKLFVKHTNEKPKNPEIYKLHRWEKNRFEKYLFDGISSMGKTRRVISRWRKNHLQYWETDCLDKSNNIKTVSYKKSIIDQIVDIERLTPSYDNNFFGYYDLPCQDDNDTYALSHGIYNNISLPKSDDLASLRLIDIKTKQFKILDTTNTWCHQQGSMLQFGPKGSNIVFYNKFNPELSSYTGVSNNFVTGEKVYLPNAIAAMSRSGDKAVSLNFSRLFDYRPGYGYGLIQDKNKNISHPTDDGIFLLKKENGAWNNELILSYEYLWFNFIKEKCQRFENNKAIVNHVCFSPDGSKLLILLRQFSGQEPYPTFTLIYDLNTKSIKQIFQFASHYHWRDNETIIFTGSSALTKEEKKIVNLYEININTGVLNLVDSRFFKGDGHCSYSPDRNMILFDSYASENYHYRSLFVYDINLKIGKKLGSFYSDPSITGNNVDTRCDLHPRWSPSGKYIQIDSTHEGYRAIYSIKTDEIKF